MSDNLYLNLTLPNLVTDNNPLPQNKLAIYEETLSTPIINCPEDYYASILRFSIPLDSLPILSFPLNPFQNNPNQSLLQIGIQTAGGTKFPQFVIFVPQTTNIPAPTPASSSPYFNSNQITSQYYYIFSIVAFITMINNALAAAFTAAGSPGGGAAPFYIYKPASQTISLIVTSAFIGSGAQIFMNGILNTYLYSFFYNTINDPNTGEYQFFHNLSVLPYGQSSPYEFMEEYSAIPLWGDIRKVVVTTNSLPITQEVSPTFNSITTSNNSQTNYTPIITDFVVTYNNIADLSSVLVYNPTAQYRLCDMSGRIPLYRINIQFYWLSKNGNLYPIFISPNQTITVKLGFFKKSLYNCNCKK